MIQSILGWVVFSTLSYWLLVNIDWDEPGFQILSLSGGWKIFLFSILATCFCIAWHFAFDVVKKIAKSVDSWLLGLAASTSFLIALIFLTMGQSTDPHVKSLLIETSALVMLISIFSLGLKQISRAYNG